MQVDDDTFLALPNVIRALKALDCRNNVYWGTSQGSGQCSTCFTRWAAADEASLQRAATRTTSEASVTRSAGPWYVRSRSPTSDAPAHPLSSQVDWLGRLDLAPSSRVGTEDARSVLLPSPTSPSNSSAPRMGYFLHWLSNTQKSLFAPSETPGNDSFEFSHPRSPVERVDTGWGMGDWDQITVTTETIAAHWLKLDHWCVPALTFSCGR